jgi:hypothetical protein
MQLLFNAAQIGVRLVVRLSIASRLFEQKGGLSMRLSTAVGLVLFLSGFSAESAGKKDATSGSDPSPAWTVIDGRNCGSSGASCQVLGQSLENPRSISKIRADGTFFVGTSGNAQSDLINELISNQDSDSSTIYRYTEAGGLAPWVTQKPPRPRWPRIS